MKLAQFCGLCAAAGVAPYAGAWIETTGLRITNLKDRVAPYAGAWIETPVRATVPPTE
mgnify:CR=1 FL=1